MKAYNEINFVWQAVTIVGLIVGLLLLCGLAIVATEPECPVGTKKVYSKGWYCTVPPVGGDWCSGSGRGPVDCPRGEKR